MTTPDPSDVPLARHELLHSTDLDEAREVVGVAFCAHNLALLNPRDSLAARFHSVQLGAIGLNYLDYGAAVHISPRDLDRFYLIQIPLSGQAEITSGDTTIISDAGLASITAPDQHLDMRWGENNPQLIVWIDRSKLEDHLRQTIGRPVNRPLRFELGMDLSDPAIRSWRRAVEFLRIEIDDAGRIPSEPLAMRELERLVMTQLLVGQPSNYSEILHAPTLDAAPRVVRRAAELIEAHAAEPLTVEDIAEAVGLSVRALQEGFRKHLDITPVNYLREMRLRKVHSELVHADATVSNVTDIALRWGFAHLGRFSLQYRERYGESPSNTLRG
jgi:AraC-like DNA-binding protein